MSLSATLTEQTHPLVAITAGARGPFVLTLSFEPSTATVERIQDV